MMNTKINDEVLKQVTGGRGYDRDDDPKHDGESEFKIQPAVKNRGDGKVHNLYLAISKLFAFPFLFMFFNHHKSR